jgi:hypothetical protein
MRAPETRRHGGVGDLDQRRLVAKKEILLALELATECR